MASSSAVSPPVLEADPDFNGDSDYGSSVYESDTTSLISAVKNHVFENGRRYHGYKPGKYVLPNDEAEQDRMDLMHHCLLLALHGELSACPAIKESPPQRILDIGTGTGIWAIDIADEHPSASVIGVDLSPIQPNYVPPNLVFEVDDIEEPWHYKANSFDYIHIRGMAGSIYDWPKLYRQAFKALKPGGWIEVQDFCDGFSVDDDSLPPENILAEYSGYWETTAANCGREWATVAPGIVKALEDVGCVDITETIYKLPIGCWAKGRHEKVLGAYWRQQVIDGTEGVILACGKLLGWEKERVDGFLPDVHAALKNPKFHTYSKFYCTYGRKALPEESE
ncbi:hypothetical protein RUND412_005061 [Rhizina undulata]